MIEKAGEAIDDLAFHHSTAKLVEEADRHSMVDIVPTFVNEPPAGVRVEPYFFEERKKATPSNFGVLASPTARSSARSRVMRGLAALVSRAVRRTLAGMDTIYISRGRCRPRAKASSCALENKKVLTVATVRF